MQTIIFKIVHLVGILVIETAETRNRNVMLLFCLGPIVNNVQVRGVGK